MKIIGLTGGYKTGKSTVSSIFKKFGLDVIDADKLAQYALKPKTKTFKKIIEVFGKGILDKKGKIDRRKLANLVFGNKYNLKMLNNIIHPEVIKDIKKIIAKIKKSNPEAMVIIEVPLLFEANMQDMMDKIIVVSAKRNIQLERAKRRTHLAMVQIRERINSQMPLSKKKRLADIIINNNGSLKETRKQVKKIWKKVKE